MNIQLIESLAQAIQALSPEERELLNKKLTQTLEWQSLRSQILINSQAIQKRRNSKLLQSVDTNEIIHQMREDRDQQLMTNLFPNEETR